MLFSCWADIAIVTASTPSRPLTMVTTPPPPGSMRDLRSQYGGVADKQVSSAKKTIEVLTQGVSRHQGRRRHESQEGRPGAPRPARLRDRLGRRKGDRRHCHGHLCPVRDPRLRTESAAEGTISKRSGKWRGIGDIGHVTLTIELPSSSAAPHWPPPVLRRPSRPKSPSSCASPRASPSMVSPIRKPQVVLALVPPGRRRKRG